MPNIIGINEAQNLIEDADRMLVIGCSGGGKSTLAQRIASKRKIEYISLDRDVRWLPDWKPREANERRRLVEKLILGEQWIMDGTYPTSFDIRLPRTDIIIWVKVPRYVCLYSVYKRSITNLGKTRPDMAKGCVEQLPDREFLSYIWNFEKKSAPIVKQNIDNYGPDVPLFVLTKRAEVNLLIS